MRRLAAHTELEELPDWSRMPKVLQQRFFELAEAEAERLFRLRIENFKKIGEMRKSLPIERLIPHEGWNDMLVACVDGSDSPVTSDRVGVRYGLVAAGYKLFRGMDPIDVEEYMSDYYCDGQLMPKEKFTKILDLITTYYERLIALDALRRHRPDILMVDGSFFGYRSRCSEILDDEINWSPFGMGRRTFARGRELVEAITDMTIELLRSGRAVGIIKRVSTVAIDGWIAMSKGDKECLDLNDRSILNYLTLPGEVFWYHKAFKEHFDELNWYRTFAKEVKKGRPEDVIEKIRKKLKLQIKTDLGDESYVEHVRSTLRCYVKTSQETPPVCVEFWKGSDGSWMEKVLWYIYSSYDPATGLPFALDIVDSLVSLPRGVAKEFAEEVEARLLISGIDHNILWSIFYRFNPQKEE